MKRSFCSVSLLAVIVLLLSLTGCFKDSALSDTEFDNPKLIKPYIKVAREYDYNSNLSCLAEVWLFDKNINTIRLKNGEVRINGIAMDINNIPIGTGSYYTAENIINEVESDTYYGFEIELSNGEIYTADITTQNVELNEVILPETHDHTKDLEVKWKEVCDKYDMNISVIFYYENDTASGNIYYNDEMLQSEIEAGKYIIPKKELISERGTIYKAVITVTSINEGNIDNSFRDGRKIESIFSAEGKTEIY